MNIGAKYLGGGECEYVLWAPLARKVVLRVVSPFEKDLPLKKTRYGYWRTRLEGAGPGVRYLYLVDDAPPRPDPVSHFQPEGVHGPSELIDHGSYRWGDGGWKGIPLEDYVIYELHVGTFTPAGTFRAAIERLDDLVALGVTAVELMPVGQFPGTRNWGYDGVYPFAVQNSYGGPEGLKAFVDACHTRGLAVVLDVVYNHFGPEGNYLHDYGPYFTSRFQTPWGDALNFDGPGSDHVRKYFIENARHWRETYHIDALRLDAIHGIIDTSAHPFLRELAEKRFFFAPLNDQVLLLFSESDWNDVKVVIATGYCGFGHDAQWCDDFHHSLHALLTGERDGYYKDFGKVRQLAKALREGFVYDWIYSRFRRRRHGSSSRELPPRRFIVYSQNHDQIGNRGGGKRLSRILSFEALKLAAGAVLLSPYLPLIFMGEEYGEENPFHYFIEHSDPELRESVREGRKKEFSAFDQTGDFPDPADPAIFEASRLDWRKRESGRGERLLEFYRRLIEYRKQDRGRGLPEREDYWAAAVEAKGLVIVRRSGKNPAWGVFNFSRADQVFDHRAEPAEWIKAFDSADRRWSGPGSPLPERVREAGELTVRAESFAWFERAARPEAGGR